MNEAKYSLDRLGHYQDIYKEEKNLKIMVYTVKENAGYLGG